MDYIKYNFMMLWPPATATSMARADGGLAFDFAEITGAAGDRLGGNGFGAWQGDLTGEKSKRLIEGGHGMHVEIRQESGLTGGVVRQEHSFFAEGTGELGDGEGAPGWDGWHRIN
jgi:hypothetical protein